MTDTLRDRIAEVLYHQHYRYGNPDDITWDELEEDLQNRYRQDAGAVIEALKLKREETLHSLLPDYERNTVRTNVWATRYVTEWTTDE